MATVEYVVAEQVTSITHMAIENGDEAHMDPIAIGFYSNSGAEVFIDQGGNRVQIQAHHLKTILKQLKRAHDMAVEQERNLP